MGFRKGTDRSISGNNPWCRVVGHLKFSLFSWCWKDHPKSQGEMLGSPQNVSGSPSFLIHTSPLK